MNVGLKIVAVVALLAAVPESPAHAQLSEQLPPDLSSRKFGHDWPSFLGPERNGKSRETGLDWNWSAATPEVVWHVALGESYSAPSVSRGRLFHFDRYDDVDRLMCRNAETGAEIWSLASPTNYVDTLGSNDGPRCTPVVDGSHVYTFSAEGVLQCVRVVDGQRVWQIDTSERFHVARNFFGVGSTPLVVDDKLIVNVGGSPPGSPKDMYAARGAVRGNGTGVVAFDKRTGEILWQASDELASYASPVAATIEGRPWCFVLARGGLVGLHPGTGSVDFEYPWRATMLESVNASTPVVAGDEVFISEAYGPGGALLRVQPGSFDVVWKDSARRREKAMALYWNTPIYHERFLYGSSGQYAGTAELRCIEWSTGKVRWSQSGLGRCSLLYADGHLVCLCEDGNLILLTADPRRYEEVARVVLRDEQENALINRPARAAPVLARGLLYVRGADQLVCIDIGGD